MQGSILARFGKNGGKIPRVRAIRFKAWHCGLLVLVAACFVAWILRERWQQAHFHWAVFAASFLGLDWKWMTAAALLALLTYYGRALRWRVMLEPLRPDASIWELFKATAIGFTAVVLLGRPGEFVRPYLIATKERVPFSSQLAAWFLERMCDLLAVLLIFGFTLTQVDNTRAALGPKLAWVLEAGGYVLAIVGGLCLIILVMLSQFSGTMRRRLLEGLSFLPPHYHQKADHVVTAFLEGTAATQTRTSVFRLMFFTLLEWALIVMCFICLFRSYPAAAGFGLREILIFMGFVAFGSIIQIPGLGGGVQLVSIVVLREIFGLPLELATSMAIMIWLISFVLIVPFGLLLACHEGLNWKRFRALEREAVSRAQVTEKAEELV